MLRFSQAMTLVLATTASLQTFAATPDPVCLPSNPPSEAKSWPVCAIYMHGLFGSNPYPITAWEVPFRKALSKVATEKRCRIAVPIGNKGQYYNWNSVSLTEMKKRAVVACGANKMIEHPSIIGFSNAANVLRTNAAANCATVKGFAKVTLVGDSASGDSKNKRALACGNVNFIHPHSVPSNEALTKSVTYVPPREAEQDRASSATVPKEIAH